MKLLFILVLASFAFFSNAQISTSVVPSNAEVHTYKSVTSATGDRINLSCDGAQINVSKCTLEFSSEAGRLGLFEQLRFNVNQKSTQELIGKAVSVILEGQPVPPGGFLILKTDREILKLIYEQSNKCMGESAGADVMAVCSGYPEQTGVVVLFMRQQCSGCGFEPVILRKSK